MKTILITGCNGQIGKSIISQLQNNDDYYIIGIDRKYEEQERVNEFYYQDLSDFDFDLISKNIDYIIHLASTVGSVEVVQEYTNVVNTNVLGTLELLERYPKAKFLFVSSSEIYGFKEDESLCSENDLCNLPTLDKRSVYGLSKALTECICQYHSNWLITRLFNVYGPHMNLNSSKLTESITRNYLAKQTINIYHSGLQKRTFTYVDDCAKIILDLLFSDAKNQVLNVASDDYITIKDFASMFLISLEKEFKIPYSITYNVPSEYDRTLYRKCNNTKIKNIRFNFTSLQDGIDLTIKWIREKYALLLPLDR
jgi:nucleoside-diphosphate-sugar epimerase